MTAFRFINGKLVSKLSTFKVVFSIVFKSDLKNLLIFRIMWISRTKGFFVIPRNKIYAENTKVHVFIPKNLKCSNCDTVDSYLSVHQFEAKKLRR